MALTSLSSASSSSSPQNYVTNSNSESGTAGWNIYNEQQTVTVTSASPGVFTSALAHGYTLGQPVTFWSTSSIPTGLTLGTTYYVVSVPSSTTYTVSASLGGTAVNTSSTGSGTIYQLPLRPLQGTGGTSAGPTLTQNLSTPIHGISSFQFGKPANSQYYAGHGVSCDFSIDSGDQMKVLQVSMDYQGTNSWVAASSSQDSSVVAYLYDKTNGVLIQPTTFRFFAGAGFTNSFIANFQTASNSTSYRLILHCTDVTTNLINFNFDNVVIAPTQYSYNTVITDWTTQKPATPVNFGTLTTQYHQSRRVGGDMEFQGYFFPGTLAAANASLSLPVTLDTSRIPNNSTGYPLGFCYQMAGSGAYIWPGISQNSSASLVIFYDGSTTNTVFMAYRYSGTTYNKDFASGIFGASTAIHYYFKIPVQGWAIQQQTSDLNDQRIVAASYFCDTSGGTVSTTIPLNYNLKQYDTHSAVSVSSSAWRFTAPIAGIYRLSVTVLLSANNAFYVYKNGTQYGLITNQLVANGSNGGSISISLNANDYVDFRPSVSTTVSTTAASNIISIERITNPAQISSTETIAVSYWVSAAFTASTTVPINFDSKEYDSHGSLVTTSPTAWKFTAQTRRLYSVSVVPNGNTGSYVLQLYKNGTAYKTIAYNNTNVGQMPGSVDLYLNAGDYIDIRPTVSTQFNGGTLASNTGTNISIKSIGI